MRRVDLLGEFHAPDVSALLQTLARNGEFMTKFQIAISTLLIGFALGQSVDWLKYNWQIRRKKKAVEAEIHGLREELEYRIKRIGDIIAGIKKNPDARGAPSPGKIDTVIYDNFYPDIAPFHEARVRKSISNIYSAVSNFNSESSSEKSGSLDNHINSLVKMLYYAKLALSSANFYLEHKGAKLIEEDERALSDVNKQINRFIKEHGL